MRAKNGEREKKKGRVWLFVVAIEATVRKNKQIKRRGEDEKRRNGFVKKKKKK